ncbi:MAG TPA: hypothetical protein VM888_14145 [Chitinophagaceae bacterium]|nr:hypothetical protein [Chitinophagaceae bacterium]
MANNQNGKPSDRQGEQNTGKPSKLGPDDLQQNEQMTDKYTNDDQDIKEGIRTNNPNRNTEKDDATNAGGYRQ